MSQVTRFAARDAGPVARVAGFMAHLRDNGFRLGVAETDLALRALSVTAPDADTVRRAVRVVVCGSQADWARFDDLFAAYWRNGGRVRPRVAPPQGSARPGARGGDGVAAGGNGALDGPDGSGDVAAKGTGRLVASDARILAKTDLRDLVSAADIRAAEAVARRLGAALRDRRSRRRRAAARGRVDLRRTLRQSLATGGEPLRLCHRARPDRPVRIVALVDVSGSMAPYAQAFLAFLAGLMRADGDADAWLFHTRLVRITEALRDGDALRALARITLLAEGFGGGSRIGANLMRFGAGPARTSVNGRTVVMILSDGYDSGPPGDVGLALERLRRRGCRIVWLNPLKGWRDYAPLAGGMAAALPHLDLFAAAGTLADLAALEAELARL